MKFLTTMLTALIAATSANAAAKEFTVRDLSAGCLRHGTGCSIAFQVRTDLQPDTQWATCAAHFPNAVGEIPEQPFNETGCSDSAFIWSYRIVGIGPRTFNALNYTLTIAHSTQGLAATKIWPAEQWPVINDGSSFHQLYVGPNGFTMRPT